MTEFARLQDFVRDVPRGSADEIEKALERVSKALSKSGERGLVQVRVLGEQGPFHAHLKLTPKQSVLYMEAAEKPNLEIITRAETAWNILDGSLSPLEAVLSGKMRFRGDAALGSRLLRQIAVSPDAKFDICEIGA